MVCETGPCNKSSTPDGIFITKAKEAPSPHEVRPTPLGANPVFQCHGCSPLPLLAGPILDIGTRVRF